MRSAGQVPLRNAGRRIEWDPRVHYNIGEPRVHQGSLEPCSFLHEDGRIILVVHGDDCMPEELRKNFELNTEVLRPDTQKGDVQEIEFLNQPGSSF